MSVAPMLHYPGLELDDVTTDDLASPLPNSPNYSLILPQVGKKTIAHESTMIRVSQTQTSGEIQLGVVEHISSSPTDTTQEIKEALTIDYNYSEGSPDISKRKSKQTAAELYGYGSGSPDVATSKLVSESTDHYRIATSKIFEYDGTRVPRRSSLKACSSYGGEPLSGSSNHHGERHRPTQRRNSAFQVRMRGERNPIQRRRSIDFANHVHVKEIQSAREMTENIGDLWLQADDFAKMKEHRQNLLQQYKIRHRCSTTVDIMSILAKPPSFTSIHHSDENNHDDSFRGLERYIDKSGRRQKNMAWDAVLLEQDEQECCGYFDEHRIAELYKYTTLESPQKAIARALQDQEAVKEYLMSPRTTKLMAKTDVKAFRRLSC